MSGVVSISSLTAALLARAGYDVRRHHLAAFTTTASRPAKKGARAAPGRMCATPALGRRESSASRITCSRLRGTLSGARPVIEDFARQLWARRDARSRAIRCKRAGSSFRDPAAGPRANLGGRARWATGHLRRERVRRAATDRRCNPRRRRGARPELFPLPHDPRGAGVHPPFPLGWAYQGRHPGGWAREFDLPGRRQARQPGHLLCAAGILRRQS